MLPYGGAGRPLTTQRARNCSLNVKFYPRFSFVGGSILDLTSYLRLLRRSILILIMLPLMAGLVAFGISKWLPPVYEASVSLLVRPSQPLTSVDPNVSALTSDQVS